MSISMTDIPGGGDALARLDPFWASLWSQGSQGAWLTADTARRQIDAGIGRLPATLHLDEDAAWERILSRKIGRYLDVLGAVDYWRTVTADQLVTLTGQNDIGAGRSQVIADLFAVGLIDVGIFSNALRGVPGSSRASLFRPSRTHVFDRKLAPRLTRAEWLSVTGGQPFQSGSQYDRHNVLTVELAMRAAEMTEVRAVVGEKLSSWDLLAHSGCGFPSPVGRSRNADATFIRGDGARIAVELTASTGPSFHHKVQRWARLLSNRRNADSGLSVVFVLATRPENGVRPGDAATKVRREVALAARDNPGVSYDRTAERMAVVEWTDWFPAPGQVSPAFLTLDAIRPTGPLGDPWAPVSLLDESDLTFTPAPTFDPLAALDNLTGLRAMPRQLRTGKPAQVWPEAVRLAGFDRVPVPAPTRPETYKGKPLGAAFGVSGDAKPPARLLFGA